MGDETERDHLLDVLGDGDARRILAGVSDRPRSAKELAAELDLSLPTVYRRLDRLADHGIVASTDTVEDDGTHYKRFAAAFDRAVVTLDDGAYAIRVDHGDEVSVRDPPRQSSSE